MSGDGLRRLRAMGDRLDRERTPDARLLERLARPAPRPREVCLACRAPFDRADHELRWRIDSGAAHRAGRPAPAYVPVTCCPACSGPLVEVE